MGSGLGLSIVKNILTLHNAEFGVNSVLGEGTEFWFVLDEAAKPENDSGGGAIESSCSKEKKIKERKNKTEEEKE